VKIQEIIGVAV